MDNARAHPVKTSLDAAPSNDGQERRPAKNSTRKPIATAVPKIRQELIKWNGWGYQDSFFKINRQSEMIWFMGNRYPIGNRKLPYMRDWVMRIFDIDMSLMNTSQPLPTEYPPSNASPECVKALESIGCSTSTEGVDRLFRAHGHTMHDIFTLRESAFPRIPDIVVWPTSHEDVVQIVALSAELDLVIIPFGGGTSVSGAVTCPTHEKRTIVSLDTSQMNHLVYIDKDNLTACFEAGIAGQDMERELHSHGFTSGHEPDSYEFSTLGGWVATRASGMKKNVYGNIEDLLLHVKMVTPKGVLQKNLQAPRLSCGPDFHHIILGSEGTLGVITEVTIKIRPIPKCKKYGSLVFPDFESGVKCMREIARQRCQPASIRLMDNEQFKFGQALRPESTYFGIVLDGIKQFIVTKIKGFDPNQMCVATILHEGEPEEVKVHEKKLNKIAGQFGGLAAGAHNGERGYCLTFVIAYIRDLGLEFYVLSESFETSVPWDRTTALVKNVKHRLAKGCEQYNIKNYLICCRVTQTYDSGCCIYFYFAFKYLNIANPVETYELLEEMARDEIVASGGSISHHHGVGKLRKKWYPATVSTVGVNLYTATKNELDPNNIFAAGNLLNYSKL